VGAEADTYRIRPASGYGVATYLPSVGMRDLEVLSAWLRDVAPSDALRRWYGHKPARWEEFRRRYRTDLASNRAAFQTLRDALSRGAVTLVCYARDGVRNQAVVLREYLLETKSSSHKAS